jgi:hypothetical protein
VSRVSRLTRVSRVIGGSVPGTVGAHHVVVVRCIARADSTGCTPRPERGIAG